MPGDLYHIEQALEPRRPSIWRLYKPHLTARQHANLTPAPNHLNLPLLQGDTKIGEMFLIEALPREL
jgi:hypothetical protein